MRRRTIGQRRARDRVEGVGDRDHAGLQVVDVAQLAHLRLHAAPAFDAVDAAGFDQQPVADRRVPVHGDEALQRETAVVAGLGRGHGTAGPGPMPVVHAQKFSWSKVTPNLCFGVACHVSRAW